MKNKDSKILVTGASGLSGDSIFKKLKEKGYTNILTPTHEQLDLTRKFCVNDYFKEHKPEYVFHCAGNISTHLTHHTEPYPIFYADKMVVKDEKESYEMSGGSYEMSGGSYEMSGGSYEMSGSDQKKELYSKKPIKRVVVEDTKKSNYKSGSKTEIKTVNSEVLFNDAYINLNTINAAASNGVKKIVTVGSCWNYPKLNKDLAENDFVDTSSQGSTGHDISKFLMISLLKHLKTEDSLDSTILMIPPLSGDHVHENINDKHVFAYLVNNIYVAARQELEEITLSSSPTNQRQFVHTEDFSEAAILAMDIDSPLLNVANDEVFSMEQVAEKLVKRWGYKGKINWEKQASNVGPQTLDCSLLKSKGWEPKISIDETITNRLV
jgi:nucleoside-diphosphate-sugar epimerase